MCGWPPPPWSSTPSAAEHLADPRGDVLGVVWVHVRERPNEPRPGEAIKNRPPSAEKGISGPASLVA